MHLWTEYEGNTIAGRYTLGPLQRSEGRNGFFLTERENVPATLRLTEALNDEEELFKRWAAATAVNQPNLLPILDYGRTALEGVPLAWAVLEHNDGSLSDVLRERVLTVDEAKEVATAVASALSALHAAGLVHEHVDVSNIVAVGETVKLRSDCVRECVGEFENDTPEAREALRQRDVHDFGLMLVRCLPLDKEGGEARLPTPFDRVVPNALNGVMTLDAILTALTGVAPAASAVVAPAVTPQEQVKTKFRPRTTLPRLSTLPPVSSQPSVGSPKRVTAEQRVLKFPGKTVHGLLTQATESSSGPYWLGGAIAATLLGIVLWNTGAARPAAAPVKTRPAAAAAPIVAAPRNPVAQSKPSASQTIAAATEPGWHVIAYTYNYEEQARAKALTLQRRYFALQPHVFTPTGHAPYFVALGTGLAQNQAAALQHQARRAGLPSDTYIRAF